MKEYLQYVELIGEFKPVVAELLNGLAQYEEEFDKVSDFMTSRIVKNKTAIYKGFIAEGISEDHALALTISSTTQLVNSWKEGVRNSSKSKGVK